jgi:hypothetical protein
LEALVYKYNIATGVQHPAGIMKRLVITAVSSLVLMVGIALPTLAAGNAQSGFTTGDCVSDVFYGNEPNMANGAPGELCHAAAQ